MKRLALLTAAIVAAALATAGTASATIVVVNGSAGPWDPTISGNAPYGTGDNTVPTSVAVIQGATITISYLSGLTSGFSGIAPNIDANGYPNGTYGPYGSGSGPGYTGIGSSGNFFPSHAIEPTNVGAPINLNELLGDFVNASGVVISAFAIGDGPLSILAPVGAVNLQLGLNDDIYSDNSGALNVQVTSGVPEPATWIMMLMGLGGIGAVLRLTGRKLASGSA